MEKQIASKDRLEKDIIEVYGQIDLMSVIEEHILYKGIECVKSISGVYKHLVDVKDLIPTALYKYSLKHSQTNILNIDVILVKQAKHTGNAYFHNNKWYLALDTAKYDELAKKDFDFRHPNRK